MATTKKLSVTRDQLTAFLKSHELVKQFENLFGIVDETGKAPDTEGILTIAETALAAAQAVDEKLQSFLLSFVDLAPPVMPSDGEALFVPPSTPRQRSRFGYFTSSVTQTAAANVPAVIEYDGIHPDLSSGVFLQPGSSGRVVVDTEGIYNFQFSIQIDKTSGGTGIFWIWPRVNGVDVANSASQIQIQGNDAEIFSSANFFFNLVPMDYVELMFAVSDPSVELKSFPSTSVHPAIPSIILTVSNNIRSAP